MRVKAFLLASLLTIIVLASPLPSIFGGEGRSLLYTLLLNWLESMSSGILEVNVLPVDEKGNPISGTFIIRVHNFSDYDLKPHSEIVYYGASETITFKIYRRPVRYGVPYGEEKPRWIYKPHEYTFFVTSADLKYYGAKLLRIEPVKPLTKVTLKVRMQRLEGYSPNRGVSEVHHTRLSGETYPLESILSETPRLIYETESVEWMPAVQIHSIPGVTAWINIQYGDCLFYTQKYRYLDINYDPATSWIMSGDKMARTLWSYASTNASNGTKRWFNVQVKYRYELWEIRLDPNSIWYEEIVTPVEFGGRQSGSPIQDSLCNGEPAGNSYIFKRGYEGQRLNYTLGPGAAVIERQGINVRFNVIYGNITVYVELWGEIRSWEAPSTIKLIIQVNRWYGDHLTIFDNNTKWKIIHLTWQNNT